MAVATGSSSRSRLSKALAGKCQGHWLQFRRPPFSVVVVSFLCADFTVQCKLQGNLRSNVTINAAAFGKGTFINLLECLLVGLCYDKEGEDDDEDVSSDPGIAVFEAPG